MATSYEVSDGINWLTHIGKDANIKDSNYKLGFFGTGGGGRYLQIDEWQGTSYLVNSSEQGEVQINNGKFYNDTYVISDDADMDPILLTNLPNYQSTLNIRFVNSTEVRVYNAQIRMYDGDDIDNEPVAVRARIAEIIHPGGSQSVTSRHTSEWQSAGSGQIIELSRSPGQGGIYAGIWGFKKSTVHDWYLAISVSPKDEIIVKRNFGSLYFALEYL